MCESVIYIRLFVFFLNHLMYPLLFLVQAWGPSLGFRAKSCPSAPKLREKEKMMSDSSEVVYDSDEEIKVRKIFDVFDSLPGDCLGVVFEFMGVHFLDPPRLVCNHWNTIILKLSFYEIGCNGLIDSIKELEEKENPKMADLLIDPWNAGVESWNVVKTPQNPIIMFSLFPQFKRKCTTYYKEKNFVKAFHCLSYEYCCKTCGVVVVPKSFWDLKAVSDRYQAKKYPSYPEYAPSYPEYDPSYPEYDPSYPEYDPSSPKYAPTYSHSLCERCSYGRVFCEGCLLEHVCEE